jgi:hypothetical protein
MNKLLFKASELLSSPPGFYFVLAAKGACASGFDVNPVGSGPAFVLTRASTRSLILRLVMKAPPTRTMADLRPTPSIKAGRWNYEHGFLLITNRRISHD